MIWIPIYYLCVSKGKDAPDTWTVLYDLFWGFRDCVLWFVKILFLLYGLFCVLAYLNHRKYFIAAHIFMVLGTLLATWLAYKNGFPFISVPLFLLGVWSSKIKHRWIMGVL